MRSQKFGLLLCMMSEAQVESLLHRGYSSVDIGTGLKTLRLDAL